MSREHAIEVMAEAMDRRNDLDVTFEMLCEVALDALHSAGFLVKTDGLARTDQHLADEYRRLVGDLFRLRDAHDRKSRQERAEADDSGVGGFAVNAAWAAARKEFAADLHAAIWGEPIPTLAAAQEETEK